MPTEHTETERLIGAGHRHDLEVIEAVAEACPGSYRVVRWCKVCGAVVVDIDVDNRTQPGAVMKMKFPEFLKEITCRPS